MGSDQLLGVRDFALFHAQYMVVELGSDGADLRWNSDILTCMLESINEDGNLLRHLNPSRTERELLIISVL